MTAYNTLLQFILPAVAGAIGLVTLAAFEKRQLKNDSQTRRIFLLICLVTCISIFDFVLYTREVFLGEAGVPAVFRMIDYWLYALIPATYTDAIASFRNDNRTAAVGRCSRFLTCVFLVLYMIISVFMMDPGYHIGSYAGLMFYHITELAFTAVFTILIAYSAVHAYGSMNDKAPKVFFVSSAFCIGLYLLYTLWDTRNIGYLNVVTWAREPVDLTGWFLSILNLLILYYIFCYLLKKEEERSIEEVIDEFADEYSLTDREREVVMLIYEGAGNSEISEKLFISLNTVKSHIKHIFRKLQVNSRLELIQVINEKKATR